MTVLAVSDGAMTNSSVKTPRESHPLKLMAVAAFGLPLRPWTSASYQRFVAELSVCRDGVMYWMEAGFKRHEATRWNSFPR